MAFIRSVLHLLWMSVTVIPYTLAVLIARFSGAKQQTVYAIARAWLALSVNSARPLLGISNRVTGMENLPVDPKQGVVLLCKHQSTYETFLMPAIMPRQLAYVFKKELLKIPFFGWSIGSLDMVHIDRSQGSRAFAKLLQQGRKLLAQGTWVIMFPEGTRIARGEVGQYKSGGARLALSAGVPVVPIAVTSARVWPRKPFTKRPGVVDVSIGPQISSEGLTQDELMQKAQDWIEAEMRRLDPRPILPESNKKSGAGLDSDGARIVWHLGRRQTGDRPAGDAQPCRRATQEQ
ncbi:lysophospholipid acyltransferase family protein [Diaphorobacter aerolatus]|uniref:1-acyl-sn-glycerol-3-phosphate acyltransferase n=1 Tax=Diaphorobacter aerolatus TaxID=1288495 RepID=A0A7H0GNW2_9BURK|nr:lysophospholipid acyltransferase family protein [Diaphorobacter aerolatus]QNP49978.1 1-acyl-sn-glycerol-3-phosphate acyltransferase [Diaphorobacter aerolatus]